jgi:hypothetical protein
MAGVDKEIRGDDFKNLWEIKLPQTSFMVPQTDMPGSCPQICMTKPPGYRIN